MDKEKKSVRNGRAVILCFVMMVFCFCSRDYNPFSDPANANVYVTASTFAGRDSVAIFETVAFTMQVAVREEVDSIIVSSPQNRYWSDTVLRGSANGLDASRYSFQLSFFDIGSDTTKISTCLSNGNVLTQFFWVRVFNPLKPENINRSFGDTVRLFTFNVPDRENVIYHWKFEGSLHESSTFNYQEIIFRYFSPVFGNGQLWVSDSSGTVKSPSVPFSYSFDDNRPPDIKCVNRQLFGDTIVSSDTLFAFKAIISDAGIADVESCYINGETFDYVNRNNCLFTKLFDSLPQKAPRSSPLALNVVAIDSRMFRNTARQTFYVVFDSAAPQTSNLVVDFDQPEPEISTTSNRDYFVHGTARSLKGDTLTLICRSNGREVGLVDTIFGAGEWGWGIRLDTSVTTVTVSALDNQGRLVASVLRTIVFDAAVVDKEDPVVWEVSSGGKILGNIVYTEQMHLDLTILVFDNGTGISKLIVNGDTLGAGRATNSWNWTTQKLIHDKNGNVVRIVAFDGNGNHVERTLLIYRNSPPFFLRETAIPGECCAEFEYNDTLLFGDLNQDDIDVTFPVKPENMKESKVPGHENDMRKLWWKPVLHSDAETDTLVVELGDGIEKIRRTTIFTVKHCSRSGNFKFNTSEADFPGVLQVGDTLKVNLSIDSVASRYVQYNALLFGTNRKILYGDTTGIIKWVPQLADTGSRQIFVTVGNGINNYDTLMRSVQIVPRNQYACKLSARFSGLLTSAGYLDLFSKQEPETLYFDIIDRDNLLTEAYLVTVKFGTMHTVQLLNEKTFRVMISPVAAKKTDTIVAMVLDRTNKADTLRQIAQYVKEGVNSPPYFATEPKFPDYFCAGRPYEFKLDVADHEGDHVTVITLHKPPDMSVSDSGRILWTPPGGAPRDDSLIIRLYDNSDSMAPPPWRLVSADCNSMPDAVEFKTTLADFPKSLQADVDTLSLRLQTKANTGMKPFKYSVYIDDIKIEVDTSGHLFWRPLSSDVGDRQLLITVTDRYNRSATLSPRIKVVPRNQYACIVNYTYTGPTLPSEQLTMFSIAKPESALFTITDYDDPSTEHYTVKATRRGTILQTYGLNGYDTNFIIKITAPTYSLPASDTIIVTVKDASGGSPDTTRLVVWYPIEAPDKIQPLSIWLDATNVQETMGSHRVGLWGEQGGGSPRGGYGGVYGGGGNAVIQQDIERQPTLVDNQAGGEAAVLFDHKPGNSDDGLFKSDFRQWANTSFTVFIVFSERTQNPSNRQTLISTNTVNGFSIGIACDQTFGIFNDLTTQNCGAAQQWASTGMEVKPGTWYIACVQSIGIAADRKIRVQGWLNGLSSLGMEILSLSNAGLAVGTGSTEYNGSFDGYIASIIIYERILSDDERHLVNQYLSNRYKITIK